MKKKMKSQELQILAQKVQLKLKPEEMLFLLANFLELEKLLAEFHQLKLKKEISSYRPKKAEINLKILHQLSRKYLSHPTKKKIFQRNVSSISTKNFLLLPKK